MNQEQVTITNISQSVNLFWKLKINY